MPYTPKRKYAPKRKYTPKKSTQSPRKSGGQRYRKPYVKPGGSTGLHGFDRAIYKTNAVIDSISRGFGVLGKPITGALNLAAQINPFNIFKRTMNFKGDRFFDGIHDKPNIPTVYVMD